MRITSPKNGQQVKGTIRVDAQTDLEDATYLIFRVDTERPHSTNGRPYFYVLDTTRLADGPHALVAEVYAREGLVGESAAVTIQVANAAGSAVPTAVAQSPAAAVQKQSTEPEPEKAIVAAQPRAASARPSAESAAPSETAMAAAEATPGAIDPAPSKTLAPMLMVQSSPAAAPEAECRSQQRPAVAAAEKPVLRVAEKCAAAQGVTVILDGRALTFDVEPTIREGRAFGALRTLVEESGGAVSWVAAAKQAIAKRAGTELRVTVGSSEAKVGGKVVDLGAAVQLDSDRTMVPVRTACEPLGFQVAWVGDSRTVRLCSTEAPMQVGMLLAR
ncbi:MAG: hypothetical protein JSV65_15685 [Armatimonadota bacterium]|nr:MAG: hypothetical protein JSV65_15685 [Armatimonadota bacterium]